MSVKVLLADESSTIKKVFDLGLRNLKAEIRNVQHGIDVLEVAEGFKPDIIFVDVMISKLNGYEVCSQIKQSAHMSNTPVVLMWSSFIDIDEDKFITCQADGKLEKPFSSEQLLEKIQSLTTVQSPLEEEKVSSSAPEFVRRHTPADELLFKEDLPSASQEKSLVYPASSETSSGQISTTSAYSFSNEDHESSLDTEEDGFDFDSFQNLDLNDESLPFEFSETSADLVTSSSSFSEDSDYDDEITTIPSFEEEEALLQQVHADSEKRLDPHDLSFETEDIYNADASHASIDIDAEDLELETFQPSQTQEAQTIHRNIEDSFDEMANTSDETSFSHSALSRDELKELIMAQSKEMIQSIVWEIVPDLAKQLIEKEIKRLMAEDDQAPSKTPPSL